MDRLALVSWNVAAASSYIGAHSNLAHVAPVVSGAIAAGLLVAPPSGLAASAALSESGSALSRIVVVVVVGGSNLKRKRT